MLSTVVLFKRLISQFIREADPSVHPFLRWLYKDPPLHTSIHASPIPSAMDAASSTIDTSECDV